MDGGRVRPAAGAGLESAPPAQALGRGLGAWLLYWHQIVHPLPGGLWLFVLTAASHFALWRMPHSALLLYLLVISPGLAAFCFARSLCFYSLHLAPGCVPIIQIIGFDA